MLIKLYREFLTSLLGQVTQYQKDSMRCNWLDLDQAYKELADKVRETSKNIPKERLVKLEKYPDICKEYTVLMEANIERMKQLPSAPLQLPPDQKYNEYKKMLQHSDQVLTVFKVLPLTFEARADIRA